MDEPINLATCTVAEIALDFPQSIRILNRYELDFCCNGGKSFMEACRIAHVDPTKVWDEISQELPIPRGNGSRRFHTWEVPTLIDFIVQNHHEYIRISAPQLHELIGKIALQHASDHPELLEIQILFSALTDELFEHLPKEEEIIFPAIRRITTSRLSASNEVLVANLQGPVLVLEIEHSHATELLKQLRAITAHYQAPEDVCPTYQLMYRLLEEFDDDLIQHIHLENNVLFPKIKSNHN
jgi:regulator of cell morphogenesis and NO signaling